MNKKGGNRKANRALSFFFVSISLGLLQYLLNYFEFQKIFPYYILFTRSFQLLVCPSLYLYIKYLTSPSYRLKYSILLHMVPALMLEIYCMILLSTGGDISSEGFIIRRIIFYTLEVQFILYFALLKTALKQHEENIKVIYSSIKDIDLSWLRFLLNCIVVSVGILLVPKVYEAIAGYADIISAANYITHASLSLIAVAFTFIIGYKGLLQKEIFSGNLFDNDKAGDLKKVASPGSVEKIREVMDRLAAVMKEKKPYLKPELTLQDLAEMTGLPRNAISLAINEDRKQNFYDYINSYRIEIVKEYLKNLETKDMNILEIAFRSGFNSKTTFNKFFRKNTNLTPSEYIKANFNK